MRIERRKPTRVLAVLARMTHAERGLACTSAIQDGDTWREDEIALAPVPEEWAEHEKTFWRECREIAEARRKGTSTWACSSGC